MNKAPNARRLGLFIAALQFMALPACAQDGSSTTEPAPREGVWMTIHEALLKQAEANKSVDLLFLGDSITQSWHDTGKDTWERFYVPRRVLNFGIGGDRIQNLLWRLDHGEVDGLKPKVVVLLIGTNNIGRNSNEEIAAGVKATVDRLRAKLPESKVLLLGILPRGESVDKTQAAAPADPRPAAINAIIRKLDDGKLIKYLDISKVFLDGDGRIPRSLLPDFLHLGRPGYRAWADAMEPTLWDMLEGKPQAWRRSLTVGAFGQRSCRFEI